jgi:hypothetical protein
MHTEDRPVHLQDSAAFYTTVRTEEGHLYSLHITDLRPGGGALLCATILEPSILPEYAFLAPMFSKDKASSMPEHCSQDLSIDLVKGKKPTWGPIYNVSAKELDVLHECLGKHLERSWIRPSTSSTGVPVFFVPKKDKSFCLCVDYWGLNLITKKNWYPQPLIGESLNQLLGTRYFTKLDIGDAYHWVRIKEGDKWKMAFQTHYGHFEYTVVSFGLANAPAAFQGYINRVLRNCLDRYCVTYQDDIVIYSITLEEHHKQVQEVLKRLHNAGLHLKLSKCKFNNKRIRFVDFFVTSQEVEMELDCIKTVTKWLVPESYCDIELLLSFLYFYRRFIKNISKITKLMSDMLKGRKYGEFLKTLPSDARDGVHVLQASTSFYHRTCAGAL